MQEAYEKVYEEGLHVMPLIKGAKPGSTGFKKNIETEVKIGKKPIKQAVAIAYSESGEKKKKKKPIEKEKD